jgi:2-alkenal reductase
LTLLIKRLLSIGLGAALLVTAACAPQTAATRPQQAVVSTPIESLPVNVGFQRSSAQQLPTAVPQEIIDAADAEYLLLANIYERVAPSVVNIDITVETPHPGIGDESSGSGIIYDQRGYIITNAHVIQNAQEVRVTFNDGFVTDAEIVGLDVYSDIAVVRVDIDEARLSPVVFGDSDLVRVGERAIAIGNPFGLASSMTVGIVSALGRQLPSAELVGTTGGGFQNPSIIQVDADINPGNSGGPLLNSRGELIGVNTAIRTSSGVFEGVGFAVPSRTVQRVVPELIDRGSVNYSWIGISSQSAENGYGVSGLAEVLSLPVEAGVLIESVTPDSPAAKAELQGGTRPVIVRGREICAGGDIIVAVNERFIRTMDELVAYLVMNTAPGDVVNLLVVRGEETFEVPVVLEGRPADGSALTSNVCGE